MEQRPSSEANTCPTSQEITWVNLKVHYCIHKSLSLVPILSQMNPVHTLTPYFPKSILMLSSHLNPGLFSGIFP